MTPRKYLVKQVIDGDTILLNNGWTIRYIGIDTPEFGEPYYRDAKVSNSDMVLGKYVILEKDITDRDKYGRRVRYVYLEDGTSVNAELVEQGYATSWKFYDGQKHSYEIEEESAINNHLNIWR